jgi:hypothetical protein
VELAQPAAKVRIDAVWREGGLALVERALEVVAELAQEEDWL